MKQWRCVIFPRVDRLFKFGFRYLGPLSKLDATANQSLEFQILCVTFTFEPKWLSQPSDPPILVFQILQKREKSQLIYPLILSKNVNIWVGDYHSICINCQLKRSDNISNCGVHIFTWQEKGRNFNRYLLCACSSFMMLTLLFNYPHLLCRFPCLGFGGLIRRLLRHPLSHPLAHPLSHLPCFGMFPTNPVASSAPAWSANCYE